MMVKDNPLIHDFFEEFGLKLKPEVMKAVVNFMNGLLVNERASIKSIAENTVQGQNERQMNRAIHQLSSKAGALLKDNFLMLQSISGLAVKSTGVIALDEHVIPKTGTSIEGVDYFHSTTENKSVLGLSLLSTHYYGGSIEYPIHGAFYRKQEELEKWGKHDEFKKKNEIARALIRQYAEMGLPCTTWVMDSYFMTKDNVKDLLSRGFDYLSKIKRNWKVTYRQAHWSVSDLQASIPAAEYELVEASNAKTGGKKYFLAAAREVFIKKIGTNRLIFLKAVEKGESNEYTEKYPDGWTCLVTNMRTASPKTLIETYLKRWTIETSYRDENQELHLHGCMWRDIEGQYCFIVLVFLTYRFLIWAAYHGVLAPYTPHLRTLGNKREAFKRFSDELFGEWITDLKRHCTSCEAAKILYKLVHGVNVH